MMLVAARPSVRVLWVTGTYFPELGGVSVHVERATRALCALCEVGLVTEPRHRGPDNGDISHFAVANLSRPSSLLQWNRAVADVRDVIAAFDPDVVHFGNACAAVFRSVVPAGVHAVATVHGNDLTAPWQWTPGYHTRQLIVDSLESCAHVFAVSTHTAALVRRWGVDTPLSIVRAGCDIGVFRPRPETSAETRFLLGIPAEAPVVLTVGRLVPRKGHLHVLEALRTLDDVHWIVVGSGPVRDVLVDTAVAHGMLDRIRLLTNVATSDLSLLYNACDLFVMTPEVREGTNVIDSEGFGLVFLEASACAKPVIASDAAGCKDAVVDGGTGLLVRCGDVHALRAAIRRMLDDPALARALGEAGAGFVRASGGWDRFARETYELYGELATADEATPAPPGVVAPI